jgi:hypothetical protein
MIKTKSRISLTLKLMLPLVLLACQFTAPASASQLGIEFIFDIVPDSATLSTLPATGNTFYLQGKIYPFRTVNQATCAFNTASPRQIGIWRAWGQVADDGRLVINQSLVLDAMGGTIEVQGTTGVLLANGQASLATADPNGPTTGPSEVLAVTGGVGTYRGLNGEAQVRSYCSDPTRPFRYDRAFCLGIVEARRGLGIR